MEFKWQGSDLKKISKLKDLYQNELNENEQVSSFSLENSPIVYICNSTPPQGTVIWYVQNRHTDNISDLIQFYLKIKQENNIKYIIIKDGSYSSLYGYVHIFINQFNRVIYLRNEHEIDAYLAYILIEEKIDASS